VALAAATASEHQKQSVSVTEDVPSVTDVFNLFEPYAQEYFTQLNQAGFDKKRRLAVLSQIEQQIASLALEQYPDLEERLKQKLVSGVIEATVRSYLLTHQKRLDGRSPSEIRPILLQVGFLKQAHGSALFTRGATQSLTSVILGGSKEAQLIESYDGREERDPFMLHYNFPPFSVGDMGAFGSPKRREIGHGRLARRALEAALPSLQNFPYVVRVVSEILESDGSSSMATVCASSLALMDAGVPLKSAVAGIAMGLVQHSNGAIILSDICGEEDAFGDMDFKVAGTTHGVTALQMDMKIKGVSAHVMKDALIQARAGRLQILAMMAQILSSHRTHVAAHAPRIETMKIRQDQIREVIGKGGATVKMLTEVTGAQLDIQEDGTIQIVAASQEQADKAKNLIHQMTTPITVGMTYEGRVTKMLDFGFVVSLPSGKEGLVHISECPFAADELTQRISLGQVLNVKVSQYDQAAQKIRFTLK
jgi:polyribonucleotide nucleotidyltransferase